VTKLGEMLKSAREAQGLSLEDAAQATHIRQHLLLAMEAENFKKFPSPVIARGMIRNYAKFLRLDPIEALTLYDGNGMVPVKGQRLTSDGIEFMNLTMAPRPLINWDFIIGSLLFLLVVGGAGYLAYGAIIQPGVTPTPTKTPPAEALGEDAALLLPTATPLPTDTPTALPPTDTPTPIIYGGVTVELVINESSWIQILTDDTKAFEGVLQAGEQRNWTGQRRVAIRAGNAGGVEVIVNGVSRGVMGQAGQVVDQIWEKVDDPTTLTPQPTPAEGESPAEPAATETPTPGSDEGEGPLPLESAPEPTSEGG
jgi:cytoskeleton protein RodZ